MPQEHSEDTIPVSEAAFALRMRYQRALDMVLTGQIRGWKEADGRWRCSRASVNEYLAKHARPAAATA